ncbi:MAG: hypothetical protein I8H75_00195 [Myxococcaceae bacterium]|nr:hypothetical protein [Myxococcaceae bacterium]MBH2005764.1 hypothetical protein [Myxococcaceae bacterium]
MIDWKQLIETEEKTRKASHKAHELDWQQEAAYSLCELYYTQFRTQRYGSNQRIDLRPGSDFNRFMTSHMEPLGQYEVWDALFPNKISATSAGALDEALNLLADSKIVDRVYSGDIITVQKLVHTIRKKRAKYLDNL